MAVRNDSAGMSPLVSRNAARSTFAKALALYVGRGRRYSVKQLANATGVKDRTIECAMEDCDGAEYRNPPLEAVLSIAAFLGPVFTSEIIGLAGQGAFDLPEEGDPRPGDVAADNADDNAVVTRAALDGVFDQEERRQLRPVGLRMVKRGQVLAGLAAVG